MQELFAAKLNFLSRARMNVRRSSYDTAQRELRVAATARSRFASDKDAGRADPRRQQAIAPRRSTRA
jgi:hypothetical protein